MMNEITLSFADDVAGLAELPIYNEIKITEIFNHALTVMNDKITHGLRCPIIHLMNYLLKTG